MESGLTTAQRWIMATGGVLRQGIPMSFELLGGRPRPSSHGADLLVQSWGLHNAEELEDCLVWLAREGHRVPMAEKSGQPERDFLAWDACRMESLAGWGYQAGMLDREKAWAWMLRAAQTLQSVYSSWQEVGDAYLCGYLRWAEDRSAADCGEAITALLAPGGVWAKLPWDTALEGTPPPQDPEEVVDLAPGTSIADAIRRARADRAPAATTRLRIRLAPGEYRESLVIDGGSLLLEALGPGVTLRGEPGKHVVEIVPRSRAGFTAQGITFVASSKPDEDEDEHGPSAVLVKAGLVRLRGCDLTAPDFAVRLEGGGSYGQLEDCALHDCRGGLYVTLGHAALVRVRVERHGLLGLEVETDATMDARECIVSDCEGVGVRIGGTGTLDDCRIAGNANSGVAVLPGGSAILRDCVMEGGRSVGLFVDGNANAVDVEGCTLRANQGSNAHVVDAAGHVLFTHCRFEETPYSNLYLTPGSRVILRECQLLHPTRAQVWIERPQDGPEFDTAIREGEKRTEPPRLENCRLDGRGQGAGIVGLDGARVRVAGTRIEGHQGTAIELSGDSELEVEQSWITEDAGTRPAGQTAISLGGGVRARLRRLRIEGVPNGVAVRGGRVEMEEVDVDLPTAGGLRGVSLFAAEHGEVRAMSCKLRGGPVVAEGQVRVQLSWCTLSEKPFLRAGATAGAVSTQDCTVE